MKLLPTLYKKASTGKMMVWTIGVENSTIVTQYGQLGGTIQRTEDKITEGKNIGKANETTAEEQAMSEATSKWNLKIKSSGYVEDLERAESGQKDAEGGYDCMLAHKFADHGHLINYPAMEQPKLNGHRCLAIIENGVATLWSRKRRKINSCPHIIKELQLLYPKGSHKLDGELYNHKYKDNFEDLSGMIRKKEPVIAKKPGDLDHTEIQYHMYDVANDDTYQNRIEQLGKDVSDYEKANGKFSYIQMVDTYIVNTEEEMMDKFDELLASGYEGAMARNIDSYYIGNRSYDLLKIKEFVDDDYPIVDIFEGRGTYKGCGIFICKTPLGGTFEVKMRGPKTRLAAFLNDHSLWKDKILTVKFQYISKKGIPIFPVGERFKEDA